MSSIRTHHLEAQFAVKLTGSNSVCNPFLRETFSAVKNTRDAKARPSLQGSRETNSRQTELPELFPVTESQARHLSSLFRGRSNAGRCHGGLRASQPLLFKETAPSSVCFLEHSDLERPYRAWST